MLRISKKGEEIILRDIAVTEIIFLLFITFAISFLAFFNRYNLFGSIFLVFAVVLLTLGIYNLSLIQTKTVKINIEKRILFIRNRSLVKNISQVYRFGEIAGLIFVETFTDENRRKSYKLVFPLETGERVELARSISSDESKYYNAANIINHLIFNNPKKIS